MHTVTCLNCANRFEGNFCPNCGQDAHEHRINATSILHDIPHSVLHIDRGFFHTVLALFTHPGKMLEEYLAGKRIKYFRPIAYVLIMTTVATFVLKGIRLWVEKIYAGQNPGMAFPGSHGFFQHYLSVFIFIMIPITSLVCWLFFFNNRRLNFWEHLVINTFIAAQLNIIVILIKLVGLIFLAFTHRIDSVNMNVFLTIFVAGLLFMYGLVYGYLMRHAFKSNARLVWHLVVLNFVLANIFVNGFVFAGISNPW